MTDRFLNFIPFVFQHENVYDKHGNVIAEHDPSDPGGTTKYGVDKASHPNVDVENLTEAQAEDIYYSEWKADRCELLAPKLGEVHFDACVNCGAGRANKFLATAKYDPVEYNNQRRAFYRRLVQARPSSQKYLRGWEKRVDDLCQFLGIS